MLYIFYFFYESKVNRIYLGFTYYISCLIGVCKNCNKDSVFIAVQKKTLPERIYNPFTAMGFSAMFTFI